MFEKLSPLGIIACNLNNRDDWPPAYVYSDVYCSLVAYFQQNHCEVYTASVTSEKQVD